MESSGDGSRERLLIAYESMDRSTKVLQSAHATALATEEVGRQTLINIKDQGETLRHARDNLSKADENIEKTSNIMKRMIRRVMTDKIICFIIAFVLFIVVVLIIILTAK